MCCLDGIRGNFGFPNPQRDLPSRLTMNRQNARQLTRREFIRTGAVGFTALTCAGRVAATDLEVSPAIRGLVMVPETLTWADWPGRAKRAGLNTFVVHHPESPKALLQFMKSRS